MARTAKIPGTDPRWVRVIRVTRTLLDYYVVCRSGMGAWQSNCACRKWRVARLYTLDRCMFFMSAVPPGRVLHASTAYRTTLEFSARRPFCRARSGASINLLHPARHVRTFCSLPLESGELARSCELSKSETQVTVSRGAATMVRPVAAVTTRDESDTTRRPGPRSSAGMFLPRR